MTQGTLTGNLPVRMHQPLAARTGRPGASSASQGPVASTTVSAASRPASVDTPPRSMGPVTRTPVRTSAPAARAASANANVAAEGSSAHAPGVIAPPTMSGARAGSSRRTWSPETSSSSTPRSRMAATRADVAVSWDSSRASSSWSTWRIENPSAASSSR